MEKFNSPIQLNESKKKKTDDKISLIMKLNNKLDNYFIKNNILNNTSQLK